MRIGLLGPLQVATHDGEIVLTAAKERALLQLLALGAGAEVSWDRLVAGLWGEDPPPTARKALQTYVSNLRRVLPDRVIRTTPHGYSLTVEPDAVDLHRFEALVVEGRAAQGAGRSAGAAAALVQGLALWRGAPLADLAEHQIGRVEQVRLQELRNEAQEDFFEVRLALGEHHLLVSELEATGPLDGRQGGPITRASGATVGMVCRARGRAEGMLVGPGTGGECVSAHWGPAYEPLTLDRSFTAA